MTYPKNNKPSKDKESITYATVGHVKIDNARIDEACEAYFKWKDLNTYIKSVSKRGLNMPDAISEPMGCFCLGLLWNRGGKTGDAFDKEGKKKIEFKATSNFENDLSSFSPKSTFDDLVFLRYNLQENRLYVYDFHINSHDLGKFQASKTQTVDDQRKQGRRPRLSLIQSYIEPNNLVPDVVFDIRRVKIIEDNR
ncbi:MAG: Bsp6I family type II restriction endonuclease [Coriobacteriia bacterium]|nr:Bsp6I family type II restriction endonuclease [Coriobacteriia bacterium]